LQEILDASEINDDMSTELSLDVVLYPPPKRTDFTWKVFSSREGKQKGEGVM
jgi:hypothetical protein